MTTFHVRTLAIALIGTLFVRPSPAQTLSYERAAAPAEVILRELSPKVGLTLLASPQTANEILCVRLKEARTKDVLGHLAWSIGGSWKREGHELWLVRTASERAMALARSRRHLVDAYGSILSAQRLKVAKLPHFDDAHSLALAKRARSVRQDPDGMDALPPEIRRELPADRALARLTALFTAADLVELPEGETSVFTNRPNYAQHSLPFSAMGILKLFDQELGRWDRDSSPGSDATPPVDRILLKVRRQTLPPSLTFDLLTYDAKGGLVDFASTHLSPQELTEGADERSVPTDKDPEVLPALHQAELARAIQYGRGLTASGLQPISAELRAKILNPEREDPLAYTAGEVMLNYARANDLNVIASLDDDSYELGATTSRKVSTRTFESLMEPRYETLREAQWRTFRPLCPERTWSRRMNRNVLGPFLRRLAECESMSLDELSSWLLKFPEPDDDSLLSAVLAIFSDFLLSKEDFQWLRFYGLLSPDQRRAARAQELAARDLTAPQLNALRTLLYGGEPPFTLKSDSCFGTNTEYTIKAQFAENLPNGLPADGRILLARDSSTVVLPPSDVRSKGMSANEVAATVYQTRHPERYNRAAKWDSLSLSAMRFTRKTVWILFVLSGKVVVVKDLVSPQWPNPQTVPFENLPEGFREEVEWNLRERNGGR